MADEATDEMSSYHTRQSDPKIMITTCDRPSSVCFFFLFLSYSDFSVNYTEKSEETEHSQFRFGEFRGDTE